MGILASCVTIFANQQAVPHSIKMLTEAISILVCGQIGVKLPIKSLSEMRSDSITQSSLPTISIVVTTKNEENNIRNCLGSINSQTYPADKIELIVVDNYSTDKTKEYALRFTDLVFDMGPERNTQRNFGMLNVATGKLRSQVICRQKQV